LGKYVTFSYMKIVDQGFLTGGKSHPCSGKFFLIWCSEILFYSNT